MTNLALLFGYDPGVLRRLQEKDRKLLDRLFLVSLLPCLLALPAGLYLSKMAGLGWIAGILVSLFAALFVLNIERFLVASGGIPLHEWKAEVPRVWRPPILPAIILFFMGALCAQAPAIWVASGRLDPVVAIRRERLLAAHMESYRSTALESLDVSRYKGLRRADKLRAAELVPLEKRQAALEQDLKHTSPLGASADRVRLEQESKALSRERDKLVAEIEVYERRAQEDSSASQSLELDQGQTFGRSLEDTAFLSLRFRETWKKPAIPFLCTLAFGILWALPFLLYHPARATYERTRRVREKPAAKAFLVALRKFERASLEGFPAFRPDRQPSYLDPPWNTELTPTIYATAPVLSSVELHNRLLGGG